MEMDNIPYINCIYYYPNRLVCGHKNKKRIFWIFRDTCPVMYDLKYECKLREKYSWYEGNLIE